MLIFLTHPVHGAKHALSESEALADEKNGWVRTTQEVIVGLAVDAAPITLSEDLTELHNAYEAKFGKRPHHRMIKSTIEAALEE